MVRFGMEGDREDIIALAKWFRSRISDRRNEREGVVLSYHTSVTKDNVANSV